MKNQYQDGMAAMPDEILERRAFVMKQRVRGFSYDQISDLWFEQKGTRVSLSVLADDFKRLSRQRSRELAEDTDSYRQSQISVLEIARNRVLNLVDRENPSIEAIEALIKLEARIARLMGTDAAVKSEQTVTRKNAELPESEVKRRIAEVQERIAQRLSPPMTVTDIPQKAIVGEVMPANNAGPDDDEPIVGEVIPG